MKMLRTITLTAIGILPSLSNALSLEELTAVLSQDQAAVLLDTEPTAYPTILDLFTHILEIKDDTQRSRAIRRAMNFVESPEVLSVDQLLYRLEGYEVVLPNHDVERLYAFAQEMELRLARQILETEASIESIEAQIELIRSSNEAKRERIQFLCSEVARIEAEGAAEVARIQAEVARMRAEIERLDAAISEGQRVIEELRAMR